MEVVGDQGPGVTGCGCIDEDIPKAIYNIFTGTVITKNVFPFNPSAII